ncbi:MAG TPA: SusC/RagA family TonB-linked outer membrane protein [Marinilabiliales bacterium]|nr:MAG: SusC/RagA family TonB-linked outer membrane protein [Bacteroidetes bacterium GWA2_40_14]OFX66158.1 MAG: SusC/RagA family TonB-linked outer membrane protein [Bacteroidetes bacterium GWC2_40_13]OFX72396.1 MAG: SusC/RagA family TonB-linked outer membrane protein [Bacteroidetes bacterium GWD2_40_43]OFX92015.1 MAG: SusC/RagA family TonB-linked outer membrane protein [Bacteroidetes bacterium GWE2_40_63]OFY16638.1 MAG: SusC/RagA family TonB-linked outer membrane protein [Bacteroidetes bacteriu
MKKNFTHVLLNRSLKRLLQYVLIIGAFLIGPSWVSAQTGNVSGKITDASGLPLIGANVVVKGTTVGTISDLDGNYTLTGINPGNQVLVASFIGFANIEQPVEIKANQTLKIDFTLTEDITSLDELVVIGYGVQKKKLSTGATAQVKGDDLVKLKTVNPLQALQGQTPGVNITSTSGQPGETPKINIRGLGTIDNASPLYIVDGVQVGDIKYLSNSDIESIDVLKDAASCAIYGSQAANGVIIITTRQGQQGKSQISFDAYYGMQSRAKKINLLNAAQYAQIMNEQHLNSGGSTSTMPFNLTNLPAYTSKGSANTDWLDEMFEKSAPTQNYNLGITGANEQTSYFMSLNYTGQAGIVGGADKSNYERYGARFNAEHKLYNDKIKIGQHLSVTYEKKKGIQVGNQYSNTLRSAFNVSPLLPMYDDNGKFFNTASNDIVDQNGDTYWNNTEANPYASMIYNNQNLRNTQKLVADVYAVVDLLKNLKYRSSVSTEYYSEDYRSYTPEFKLSIYSFSDYDKVTQNMSKGLSLAYDNTLTYDLNIEAHKITAMVGTWYKHNDGSWMNGENTDLGFDDFGHAWLSNALNTETVLKKITGAPFENSMFSQFARLLYNYNETYLLNYTFRRDGSSRFSEKKRYAPFHSVSAGWVLTNESFMEPFAGILNFMKIRASIGQAGNQNIGDEYMYLAPIKFTQATYNFGNTEAVSENGSFPKRLSNEDLHWENQKQIDIGFDARFLNSKMNVTFDWYNKTTKDWLILAPVLATAGTDAPYINAGSIVNTGVEFQLSYTDTKGDFSYNITPSIAFNKNEVKEIPTEDGIIHGAANTLYANSTEFYRAEDGHAIGYFWGYETDGLFQNTAEVQNYRNSEGTIIQPNAKPGDVRYVDQNGDGKINLDDKTDLGDPNPDVTFSLNLSCNYKAFDLAMFVSGVAGNQIVQSYRDHTNKYSNYTTEILDRWTGEGTSDRIPRVTNGNINYQFSDLFVKNGAYMRISNITIGYDVAKKIKVKNFSQCRIYASIQNLYTLTKYDGMDPEVGYGLDNGSGDKFSSGVDLGYYPLPRTLLMGISVKF